MWFKKICMFMLLILLSGYAYAQKRVITEAEFNTIISKALEARRLVPYRIRKSEVLFQSGVEIKTVTEHQPPGRARMVVDRHQQSKLSHTETIWIDKLKYVRVGDGPWSVKKWVKSTDQSGSESSARVITRDLRDEKIEQEFEYLGRKDLNGKPADVYQKNRAVTTYTAVANVQTIEISTYWFNDQGLLVKQTEEFRVRNRMRATHTDTEFDYDPTIKIDEPII